jgi:hypothetical protein
MISKLGYVLHHSCTTHNVMDTQHTHTHTHTHMRPFFVWELNLQKELHLALPQIGPLPKDGCLTVELRTERFVLTKSVEGVFPFEVVEALAKVWESRAPVECD